MKKQMMKKFMTNVNRQQLAEQALAVVMAKYGTEAITERNALQRRLDELKRIYPVHFLTDADINNGKTGVFNIDVVVEGRNIDLIMSARVVFMGKTADGKLKWRPTTPYNDDWGSGTFGDYDGPKYDKDDEGNRLVDEAKMDQWSAWLCPCGSDMADCFDGCCVCGNWSEGEAEDSEVDEPVV